MTVKVAEESRVVRVVLISIALLFFTLNLVIPLVSVFIKAFGEGVGVYFAAISNPMALKAVKLTLKAVGAAVVLNTVFGLAVAWAVAKFKFKGKNLLVTIIDLPFAISPVVAGLIFVLLFSTTHGIFASVLNTLDLKIKESLLLLYL